MAQPPRKIIEVILIDDKKGNGRIYKEENYLCDNGGVYNKDQLAAVLGINPNTLKVRFDRCNGNVCGTNLLRPVGASTITENALPKRKQPAWNRGDCKRDSTICAHYAKCQTDRLGVRGADKWAPPDSTDECYEPIKHPGNLHAVSYT